MEGEWEGAAEDEEEEGREGAAQPCGRFGGDREG